METTDERLDRLEMAVAAYSEFILRIGRRLVEKEVLTHDEFHSTWGEVVQGLRAKGDLETKP